jgi:ubiquinone/menaquinone biosynthesis C-methylase UbiE
MFLRPGEIIQHLRNKKYIFQGMQGADFGCGTGYFTSLLAQEVGSDGKIYAIDVDEEVIKEAQEFISQFGIKNVNFLCQNIEINCGLYDNILDFVFISQVLYQSSEPYKILAEAKRVLKNGGFLIILEPRKENPLFKGQKVYDLEEIVDLLKKEDFKIIETEEKNNYSLIISQK